MFTALLSGFFVALDYALLDIAMSASFFSDTNSGALAPHIVNFYHVFLASVILFIYICARREVSGIKGLFHCKGGRLILLSAFIGGSVGNTCYVLAVYYIGAGPAAAISALFPAVGGLISHFLLKEHMSRLQIFGLLLSVCAVFLLGLLSGSGGAHADPRGFPFAVICCLSWALDPILFAMGNKEAAASRGISVFARHCSSAIVAGAIILPAVRGWKTAIEIIPHRPMLLIFLAAIILSIVYFLFFSAVEKIGPTKAMSLNITYTAWAVIFAFLFMNVIPSKQSLALSFLIVAGSLVASINIKRKK